MLFHGWRFCHVSPRSFCPSRSVGTGFLTVCVSFPHLPARALPVDTWAERSWWRRGWRLCLGHPRTFLSPQQREADWQSSVKDRHFCSLYYFCPKICSLYYFCPKSSSTPALQLQKGALQDPPCQLSHRCLENSLCGIPQSLLRNAFVD